MHFFRDRDHLVLLFVLALGTVVYFTLPNIHGHVGGVAELDGYYYYIYLRSLHMDGDLDFANEYREHGNPFEFGKTSTGLSRNVFGVGPALLWAPFFLATHLLAQVGIQLGYPLSPDSMSRFHQVGTFYGTLLYGWLGILFTYWLVRRVVGRSSALWATLGASLAGPLPFYCLALASYSHAQAAMAVALLCLLWLRFQDAWTLRRWFFLGSTAGLLLLLRPACLPFMLVPLWAGVSAVVPELRRHGVRAALRAAAGPLVGGLAAVLVFSPQLVVWRILYGHVVLVPQGEGFMVWSDPAWASTLFSPRNGLLPNAPLYAFSLLGFLVGLRRRSPVALVLALALLGMALINGAAYDWWGWGYSARRFTSSVPILAVGLGYFLDATHRLMTRHPARAAVAATSTTIVMFILFNIQWMQDFTRKALNWNNLLSSQAQYMTVIHNMVDSVFKTLGNPFSLPMSLTMKIRHGLPLNAYDKVDGHFLLGESHPMANEAADPMEHATMVLSDMKVRYNLSASFGYPIPARDGLPYVPLREPTGHIFLPINRPGPLALRIGGRALYRGTRLELLWNGTRVAEQAMPGDAWAMVLARVPGDLVLRGLNRLDLIHHLLPGADAAGDRRVGTTGHRSPVDLAVVSRGGPLGTFAEIWLDGRQVSENMRGINLVVIDGKTGRLLLTTGLDVWLRPSLYVEFDRILGHYPTGSLVAIAVRSDASEFFGAAGRRALARIGAITDLSKLPEHGYAALGVLGAKPGTALEHNSKLDHARVHVGRPPPPWREVAQYRFVQFK